MVSQARKTPTLIDLATKKRLMFEYEHEVRTIGTRWTENSKLLKGDSGFQYPIEPEGLFDAVRIHPESDQSFMDTTLSVVETYAPALRARVAWSRMREKPPLTR